MIVGNVILARIPSLCNTQQAIGNTSYRSILLSHRTEYLGHAIERKHKSLNFVLGKSIKEGTALELKR